MVKSDRMSYCAIIVENRKFPNWEDIVSKHMDFLPGWDFQHINIDSITSQKSFNRLMTSNWLWKKLIDFDKVLFFQHDSGILREGIDEFLEWNYVGAPWPEGARWNTDDRRGGNGGISLRSPKASLELLAKRPYDRYQKHEDVFFSNYLEGVAPYEVCRKFSVESVFELGTMAWHNIDRYLTPAQCEQIRNQYVV